MRHCINDGAGVLALVSWKTWPFNALNIAHAGVRVEMMVSMIETGLVTGWRKQNETQGRLSV